ncbi:rhodanese-like domain-containing protein [Metabacillus sp. 84]|uniref:rhodanese-like domain-containing protein n=1 Tax=unclassified Metabacillus TaxID=2675274 RepID=UPI003CF45BD0
MEYLNYFFILIAVILLIRFLAPVKGVRQITASELKNELNDKDKQYIDVRTQSEFKGNHIPSFRNLPLHQLGEKSKSLYKDKEVVIICQSGMRSSKAASVLKKQGFTKITNVKGGMNAWS